HTQIVEPYSAARYFGEPYKVPHSNHNTIAKPEDDEAIQHKLLVLFIRKMMYEPKDNWPAGPIAPEGREEATKALLALNERLSAGKIEDKSALAAFSLAIIETRRYLADQRRGVPRDGATEGRLSLLWNQAGGAIRQLGPGLGDVCWVKRYRLVDGEGVGESCV